MQSPGPPPSHAQTETAEPCETVAELRRAWMLPLSVAVSAQAGVLVLGYARFVAGAETPLVVASLGLGVSILGITAVLGILLLGRSAEQAVARARDGRIAAERMVDAREALILGLAKLADYRDTDTGRHLDRIAQYSELLAKHLCQAHPERYPLVDAAWIERLRLASVLHDIGKVGIPDAVLLKPGRLTAQERSVMELHQIMGAETLSTIKQRLGADELIDMGIHVAMRHHEKWDGTGYPDGLAGEAIPLSARIVALADFYDAVTSKRVYKDAMTHAEASALIAEGRGSHFDPAIADAFEALADRFDFVRSNFQGESLRDPRLTASKGLLLPQTAAA